MSTTTSAPVAPVRNKISWPAAIWIGTLHAGALLAFVPGFFTWQALAVCVFMHWLMGGVGICMTYHRLLTHRSFTTRPKALEYVLTAIGCMASEGGPVGWVADHRKHHAHSDEEPDVHSPHRGFWWAHMLWWLTPDAGTEHTAEYYQRWAPDLARDRVLMILDKFHFLIPIATALTLYAVGGMPWLVWGFFVSTVTVLHTTWLVNSATHVWGYRSHETRDDSTNLWWVALLTYGEGWHNNHHAHQTSARHGMRWWEVDMTYMAIRALSFVGLAYAVKLPKVHKASADERASLTAATRAKIALAKQRRRDGETELVGAAN